MEMMQSIADLATGAAAAQTQAALSISTLKKAMDTEAQAVSQLFGSLAQTFPGDNGYMFSARA